RLLLRGADAFLVGTAVAEVERVSGLERVVPGLDRAVVEEQPAPTVGVELVVMAALRADLERGGELVGGHGLAALVAAAEHADAERSLLAPVGGGQVLFGPGHDDQRLRCLKREALPRSRREAP